MLTVYCASLVEAIFVVVHLALRSAEYDKFIAD